MTNFSKMTAGVLAAATLVAAASPAEAQYRYRGGYNHYRGGDRTGLALGAGALGLALGAAIGSSSRNRGYYGGDGYYGRPYAYNSYGYEGGYTRPYGYGYGYRAPVRRCWTERQWDDWRGGWTRVRVCDRY